MTNLGLDPIARGGFGLVEAPRLDAEGVAWFSDVTGGGVFRLVPGADAIEEVLPKRRGVGGLVLHERGGVVVTGRDIVHVEASGTVREVFKPAEDAGITGFNDATTDAKGRLVAGALRFNPMKGEEPVPGRVVVIDPSWVAVAVEEGVEWPNGMSLSADGTRFLVADYAHARVMAAPVDRQGAIGEGLEVWAQVPRGSADGLAVDAEGGVWVALGQGGGIARFDPEGALQEVVDLPGAFVTSLCFGGPDGRDLLVTSMGEDGGTVWRGRAPVAGSPVVQTRV